MEEDKSNLGDDNDWEPSTEIKEYLEKNFKESYQLVPKYKKV
jgi:hypothetical protein